jgi:Fe-S oxidoreductase
MNEDEKRDAAIARQAAYDFAAHFAHVRNAADLVRDPNEQAWVSRMPAQPEHHQYVVWLGCNVIRTAHIAESLSDILRHAGADFVALGGPTHCCGVVHQRRGAGKIGANMLRQTMKRFDAFTPERMLNWCPSCDTQLRNAPGESLTETVKNRETVTTFLATTLKSHLFKVSLPLKVAIHTHGGTPDEEADGLAARDILSRIPEMTLVNIPPVAKIGRHCSDANLRRFGDEAYKHALRGWIHAARAAGADRIVSIYHSCHRQLILMQRDTPDEGMEIVNYLSLIARSLGLPEREDKFQRFARSGDVDAMMAAVSPNIEKLGLNEDHARKTLTKQFAK